MNWLALVGYFVTGSFLANGVPHFVKGITGEMHQTPFGRPSSAVVNVIWGSFNFVVGYLLLTWLERSAVSSTARAIALGVGGFVLALSLAFYWSGSPDGSQ
ncbi:MAG: hypothetical protein SVX38_08220 [Chloroflexota bacterium]|nr:hypothetical protein [Chloroflexota bacterium]